MPKQPSLSFYLLECDWKVIVVHVKYYIPYSGGVGSDATLIHRGGGLAEMGTGGPRYRYIAFLAVRTCSVPYDDTEPIMHTEYFLCILDCTTVHWNLGGSITAL